MSVTVLTASLPERYLLLAEAVASVAAQTRRPEGHHIAIDLPRRGAARAYNDLAKNVTTEWVTFLDDDDLLLPDHIGTLLANCVDADVIYTRPRPDGWQGHPGYETPFDAVALESSSIVPITAMVRTQLFHTVGGFPQEWGYDWRFWQACSRAGAVFKAVEEVTWVYRRGNWPSQSHGEIPEPVTAS